MVLTCDWLEPSSDKRVIAVEAIRGARVRAHTKTRNQTRQQHPDAGVRLTQRTDWTENWVYCTAEATHTSYAAATVTMEKMDI